MGFRPPVPCCPKASQTWSLGYKGFEMHHPPSPDLGTTIAPRRKDLKPQIPKLEAPNPKP